MKWSSQKSILFQVEIIKLCSKITVYQNVNNVETIPANNIKTVNTSSKIANTQIGNSAPKVNNIQNTQVNTVQSAGGIKNWGKIVNDLKSSGKILLSTNLRGSNAVEINDMTVGISFPNGLNSFSKTILERPENMQELSKAISMEYGKEMQVRIIDKPVTTNKTEEKNSIENMMNSLDIPINIIDD